MLNLMFEQPLQFSSPVFSSLETNAKPVDKVNKQCEVNVSLKKIVNNAMIKYRSMDLGQIVSRHEI